MVGGANNKVNFYGYSGAPVFYRTTSAVLNDNKWHNVICVYSGSALTHNTYVDGILSNGTLTGTVLATLNSNLTTNVVMGAYLTAGAPVKFWAGSLDAVRVYKRALNPSEIGRLYTEPFAGIVTPKLRIRSGAAVAGGTTYPQLERQLRGVTRGVYSGN